MELQAARELVVQAGKELVSSGLIARTWGNVSCRISETHFVITPSGRAYETLLPKDIVVVNIADLSYEGEIKPSSEFGIHVQVYRLRPDINFVIHTHQTNASVISAVGEDIMVNDEKSAALIGAQVKCAAYGLPGTGKLKKGVTAALKAVPAKAVIMSNHGALCLGKDYEEAFLVASELEKVCERYLFQRCLNAKSVSQNQDNLMDCFLNSIAKRSSKTGDANVFDSRRQGSCAVFNIDGKQTNIPIVSSQPIDRSLMEKFPEILIHLAIYKKRRDINYIVHSVKLEILTLSKADITLRPLLDDLAQIVGISVKTARWNNLAPRNSAQKVLKALKGRHAVFIADVGALCCGSNQSDALAVELIMQKASKTYIGTYLWGKTRPLSRFDCLLMRMVYLKKYSKIVV